MQQEQRNTLPGCPRYLMRRCDVAVDAEHMICGYGQDKCRDQAQASCFSQASSSPKQSGGSQRRACVGRLHERERSDDDELQHRGARVRRDADGGCVR